MEHEQTPMVADKSESSLAKHMVVGSLTGMVLWGAVTLLLTRIGWPDESWGFTITLALFSGLWVGPFFGSAGGIAAYQLKVEAAEAAEHRPVDAAQTHTTAPANLTAAH